MINLKNKWPEFLMLVVIVVCAFISGLMVGIRFAGQDLPSITAAVQFSDSTSDAAHTFRVLEAHRGGAVEEAVKELERMIDRELLSAFHDLDYDEKWISGEATANWREVRKDREAHPRKTTKGQETRINLVLEDLIKRQE